MQNFLLYMILFCACTSTYASSYEELLENKKLVTIANEMDGRSTGFITLRSSNMDHITNQDLKKLPSWIIYNQIKDYDDMPGSLNKNRLFNDSSLKYLPELNRLYEIKKFDPNTIMIRNIDVNSVRILIINNDGRTGHDWLVHCSKDKMTDKKSCVIYQNNLQILDQNNTTYLRLGSSNSKTKLLFRVDQNQYKETNNYFSNSLALQFIEQMKKGDQLHTRFQQGLYKIDNTYSLKGFTKADQIKTMLKAKIK
ncbi:hypothetical protein [Acinetobacter sp. YH01012]|uniref:hypothetical protein n=1 Tax=Acinetobacter sp. YH01012 TaxID=2601028 RepID=UPI0015D45BE7|nr:hypothetical protein [Acinetobacter sp. YH01012]